MSPIEEFVSASREFCAWAGSKRHDVLKARELLLKLMQAVPHLQLPGRHKRPQPGYPRRRKQGHDFWTEWTGFDDLPVQYYLQFVDPFDTTPVLEREGHQWFEGGDIKLDLVVVWHCLRHGMQAFDAGDPAHAVRYWRDSYFREWGHRASSSLHLIDAYYRSGKSANKTLHRMAARRHHRAGRKPQKGRHR
jgi:hypothetical protein